MIFFYSETKKSQMEDTVQVLFMNKQYLLLKVLYSHLTEKISQHQSIEMQSSQTLFDLLSFFLTYLCSKYIFIELIKAIRF